jgi:hypothetical protein
MTENNELSFNIRVGGNQDQALGSLKAQLREATAEVTKLSEQFGASSKEAVQAAKRAAELKDRIGDAKSLIDAFNPDAKFKALTASLSGVAGGFSALQGAVGLFGKENEDLQKTLLKVQSAMALSQGLQAVGESIDSFKQLGTVIKTQVVGAFSTLRGAIIATGVGALAIGIGLVAANFDKVKKAVLNLVPGLRQLGTFFGSIIDKVTDFIGVTSQAERALSSLEQTTKRGNEGIEARIKVLTAQGGKEKEIYALSKQQGENELNFLREKLKTKEGLNAEELKKFRDLKTQQAVLDAQEQKRIDNAAKETAKKGADASKQLSETKRKNNEENIAAEKEAQKKLAGLNNDLFLSTLQENEKKKAELNLAFIKEKDELLANTKITEETKNQLILALRTKLNADLDAINQAQKEKKQADDAKMLEDAAAQMTKEDDLEFANLQKKFAKTQEDEKKKAVKDLADLEEKIEKNTSDLEYEKSLLEEKDALLEEAYANSLITEEQYTAGIEANAKARTEIDKQEAESKVRNAEISSQLLNTVSDLIGKNTAAGKAAAIASTTIDTYLSAQKAYASQLIPGDPSSPIRAAIAAGLAIAGGLKNVKSILAVQTPTGGGGGSANISAPSLSSAPLAPAQPQAQTTTLDSQSINAIGAQVPKAYVVESELTRTQKRIAEFRERARFG